MRQGKQPLPHNNSSFFSSSAGHALLSVITPALMSFLDAPAPPSF